MQDEVLKHTKKIIKTMGNKNHSFTDKLKEIGIEILIIVFAVTLSIKLHEWSEHRHQQKEAKEFLSDLRKDLADDIENMTALQKQLSSTIEDKTYMFKMTEFQYDSMRNSNDSSNFKIQVQNKMVSLGLSRSISGNYEGFKSSGKIGFIENKKIKILMLKYYQQLIPTITEAEKYYNLNLSNYGDAVAQLSGEGKKGKEILLSPKMKFYYNVTLIQASNIINSYNELIKAAKELDSDISKEIDL